MCLGGRSHQVTFWTIQIPAATQKHGILRAGCGGPIWYKITSYVTGAPAFLASKYIYYLFFHLYVMKCFVLPRNLHASAMQIWLHSSHFRDSALLRCTLNGLCQRTWYTVENRHRIHWIHASMCNVSVCYTALQRDVARQATTTAEALKQRLVDLEEELEEARGDKNAIYQGTLSIHTHSSNAGSANLHSSIAIMTCASFSHK